MDNVSSPAAEARLGASMEVSIVIPCLNEAKSIGECVTQAINALVDSQLIGEVVVADNGSVDGSQGIAVMAGARVVEVTRRGYGSAVRGGVAAADAEYVVLGDADGQHDFSYVPLFLDRLRAGDDLVMGNRFGGAKLPGAMSWSHRYIGNPLLSGLIRLLFYPGVHDSQCGMRGVTKSAFYDMDLRTTGFELCPEMVVKAARRGLRISEVDITVLPDRRDRPPHLHTITDGWHHLMFILLCAPQLLFIAPGVLLFVLGATLTTWTMLGPEHLGHLQLNTRAELFGVLLASFGFMLISIGTFARVFSYSEPRQTSTPSLTQLFRSLSLERALAVGVSFILLGAAGDLVKLLPWALHGFHQLEGVRSIIFWSLWGLLGVQACFSAMFLSMIGVSRGTWLGERF